MPLTPRHKIQLMTIDMEELVIENLFINSLFSFTQAFHELVPLQASASWS